MHDKIRKRLLDSVEPPLSKVLEEGIEAGVFSCDNIPQRVRILLIISNDLFDDGQFTKSDITVFIDLMEKLLGAKPGTMEFIRALIR